MQMIWDGDRELNIALNITEKLCELKGMTINKKKSGIMVMLKSEEQWNEYRGYPRVMTYKYLGVIIDNQLDPDTTLKEATKRIGVYVYRNRWLIKKHLSIRSILQI